MSAERRCPNCGGLVGRDAEWCGQCFARLDKATSPANAAGVGSVPAAEPTTPGPSAKAPPTTDAGTGPVRRTAQGLVWTCPRCELVNPIESRTCTRCGARFESLFSRPELRPTADPARAVRLSLLFPGVGHIAAGRTADGVARAVVFGWIALTIAAMVIMRGGFRAGPLLPVLLLYLGAGVAVYGITAVDAGRAAEGEPPLLTSRILLYGVGALILLTVAVLFFLGMRARA
jgi:hypothetical protein